MDHLREETEAETDSGGGDSGSEPMTPGQDGETLPVSREQPAAPMDGDLGESGVTTEMSTTGEPPTTEEPETTVVSDQPRGQHYSSRERRSMSVMVILLLGLLVMHSSGHIRPEQIKTSR